MTEVLGVHEDGESEDLDIPKTRAAYWMEALTRRGTCRFVICCALGVNRAVRGGHSSIIIEPPNFAYK
jgi:hypothetical protein